jgi:putative ABC transport system permease protein
MDNLVFSNMMHRPARTVVSILGIAIGVLLIVFTVGLANGSLREQAKREANVGAELFLCASGSFCIGGSEAFRLPISMTKELEKIEGVKSAVAIGQQSVDADSNTGKRLIDGVNFDEYAAMSGISIVQGRQFTDKSDEAIVDTGFQNQKKFKIGDSIKLWERNFTIVGAYEPAGGARVKVPLSTMQKQVSGEETNATALDKASAILIKIKEGFTEEQVGDNVLKVFPNNQLIRTKDLEELYLSSIPALGVFLNVIIGVAAAISALVILLTMYTTVTERTRQIGILKSLGMTNEKIAWIITQEALLLSFCGILAGVFLTVALRFVLTRITTLEVEISPLVLTVTLFVGLLGGALGALYPALRAARLDAVEALSYE